MSFTLCPPHPLSVRKNSPSAGTVPGVLQRAHLCLLQAAPAEITENLREKGTRNHSFKDEVAALTQGHYFPGEYRHLPDEAPSTRLGKK